MGVSVKTDEVEGNAGDGVALKLGDPLAEAEGVLAITPSDKAAARRALIIRILIQCEEYDIRLWEG